jgi:hypothetical protein
MTRLPLVLIAALSAACAQVIHHPSAPPDQVEKARKVEVAADKARAYFVVGYYVNDRGVDVTRLNEAIDVMVDSKKIVTLGNNKEIAFVDLAPGKHTMSCRGESAGSDSFKAIPVDLDMLAGAHRFLACSFFLQIPPDVRFLWGDVGVLATMDHVWGLAEKPSVQQDLPSYDVIALDP